MGLRLLLDSHAVYWALTRPDELSEVARTAISDPANDVFVSAASIYELTYKTAIGKLDLGADLVREAERVGLALLAITPAHAQTAAALPLHHRDPWDRLLVAQSRLEGLTIVTRDPVFETYGAPVLPT